MVAGLGTAIGEAGRSVLGDRHRRVGAFFRRLLRNPVTLIAFVVLVAISSAVILAPYISPFDAFELHVRDRVQGPNSTYWLGTDEAGRDILSLLLAGGRNTLLVGISSEGAGLLLGVPFGLLAGFFRGKVDDVIMRFMDGMLAFPGLLLALLIVAFFGPELENLIAAIGITMMPMISRIVRSAVIQEREREYVTAAYAVGARNLRIMVRHILPNSFAPLIVQISFGIALAILVEAGLSFLGLGIQPPKSSWGVLLRDGYRFVHTVPTFVTFPGLAIFFTVWSLNVLGDGLRDTLDPRLRGTQ